MVGVVVNLGALGGCLAVGAAHQRPLLTPRYLREAVHMTKAWRVVSFTSTIETDRNHCCKYMLF